MNILMVCTGNICRSPMAEGLLRHLVKRDRGLSRVRVFSAGTLGLDGAPASPFAIQAAAEMGVDITGHRARSLDPAMVRQANLILTMEPFQRDIVLRAVPPGQTGKVQLLADYETPRRSDCIEDPYRQPLDSYRACIRRMAFCLDGVVRALSPHRLPSGV